MFARSILAAVVGTMLVTPAAFAGPSGPPQHRPAGVNAREHRQTVRIKNGVKNGEITKADEAAIRAEEKVYRHSGNGLNKRETKDLEKDLNKTNREIYRAKHNDRQPASH